MKDFKKILVLLIAIVFMNYISYKVSLMLFENVLIWKEGIASIIKMPSFYFSASLVYVLYILIFKGDEISIDFKKTFQFLIGLILAALLLNLTAYLNKHNLKDMIFKYYNYTFVYRSLILIFISSVLASLAEELIFRKYIQNKLYKHLTKAGSVLIAALIYVMYSLVLGYSNLGLATLFFVNIVLGYIYLKTENISMSFGYNLSWKFLTVGVFSLTRNSLYNLPAIFMYESKGVIKTEYMLLGASIFAVFLIIFVERREKISKFFLED